MREIDRIVKWCGVAVVVVSAVVVLASGACGGATLRPEVADVSALATAVSECVDTASDAAEIHAGVADCAPRALS